MAAKPSLEQALQALRRDPTHPVRARVDDLTVELRAVTESASETAAASLLGLMADEPDVVDQMCAIVYQARGSARMRKLDG